MIILFTGAISYYKGLGNLSKRHQICLNPDYGGKAGRMAGALMDGK